MNKKPLILGIETSCDETAASLISENEQGIPIILSNIISSQTEVHKKFGGVVPELAARSHLEKIDWIVQKALDESGKKIGEIDAVDSVPNLVSLLDDESVNIRRNVVEALGIIQGNTDTSVHALAKALVKDEDKQTRFTSALSLARIGPAAEEAVPALKDALKDNDRYVRGYGVEALKYIGTPEAKSVLIDHLMTMRWCTSTNKASTF